MADKDQKSSIYKAAFRFLTRDYGCKLLSETLESSGEEYLTYCNETSGVKVSWEPRSGGLFVMLFRLKDGEVPEYPVFVNEDTECNWADLADLADLEGHTGMIHVGNPTEASLDERRSEARSYAETLRKVGGRVLSGDFSVFEKIEKIVKKRARDL